MKKKKLLKRIEELESALKNERKKYKDLLFEDDKEIIEVKRLEYKIKEDIEHCFFFGLTSGVNTFTPLTNPIYHHDPILFKKYCKECKYPILRLDKLATVLKNGQRIFRYEK